MKVSVHKKLNKALDEFMELDALSFGCGYILAGMVATIMYPDKIARKLVAITIETAGVYVLYKIDKKYKIKKGYYKC